MTAPSTQVTFTRGDDTWKKLRQRGLDDLYFFAQTIMGYGELIPMRELAHRPLTVFLDGVTGKPELDLQPVRLILQPRELGKSSIARCWIIRQLCKYPNRAILLCSETATLAEAILSSIKQEMLTNELLRELYHDVIPVDEKDSSLWRVDKINVKRTTNRPEPSLMVAGVDKAITGFHPDDIVVDDMVGREAAENARIGDRALTLSLHGWIKTLVPIVNKQASPHWTMKFIGTNWYQGDPYSFVEEYHGRGEEPQHFAMYVRMSDASRHKVKVYSRGDLAVMRRGAVEEGRSIFPDKWDIEKLAEMRMADPQGFACWYMNQPTDEVTQIFKNSWVGKYEWQGFSQVRVIENTGKGASYQLRDLDILIACDPGGFRREMRGAGRARPAVVVTGTTPTDRHLVLEAWSEDVSYNEAADRIIEFAQRYGPRKIIMERAGQQVVFIDLVKKLAAKAKLNVSFDDYMPTAKDKSQRILGLEPFFQHNQILLDYGPRLVELRNQIQQFPNGARVDVLDALHMLMNFWRKPGNLLSKNQDDRRAKEMAMLRERMGGVR